MAIEYYINERGRTSTRKVTEDRFETIRLGWLKAKSKGDKAKMGFWWDEMRKIMSYADTEEFFGKRR